LLTLESVKETIREFFEAYSISDLYYDAQELIGNEVLLDKQELYLYFGDISFNKSKYPIFYIPISLVKAEDGFRLVFDSLVYVNKKALEPTFRT